MTDESDKHSPAADIPRFERRVFEELMEMFDETRLRAFVANLDRQIGAVLATDPADPAAMAPKAHKLITSAGILGFKRISELALQVETACIEGREVSALLSAIRTEATAKDACYRGLLAA